MPGPKVGQTIALRKCASSSDIEECVVTKVEPIQELWDGFGLVSRVHCKSPSGAVRTAISKHISPPPLKGAPGSSAYVGTMRKLDSFCRELNTYRLHPLFQTGRDADEYRVPLLLGFQTNLPPPYTDGAQLTDMVIWLEDMCASGHTVLSKRRSMGSIEVRRCLDWLAWFHASSAHEPPSTSPVDRGSYWFLATRPHEFEWLKQRSRPKSAEAFLCDSAASFAAALDNALFKCTMHGDPKPPNFLIRKGGESVAAVDFQYAGQGCGPQDVAYLLHYEWDSTEGDAYSHFWRYYFDALATNLEGRSDLSTSQRTSIVKCWRELVPVAIADFARFYCGWSQSTLKEAFGGCAELPVIESMWKGTTPTPLPF